MGILFSGEMRGRMTTFRGRNVKKQALGASRALF
jgi:hypothetical protein